MYSYRPAPSYMPARVTHKHTRRPDSSCCCIYFLLSLLHPKSHSLERFAVENNSTADGWPSLCVVTVVLLARKTFLPFKFLLFFFPITLDLLPGLEKNKEQQLQQCHNSSTSFLLVVVCLDIFFFRWLLTPVWAHLYLSGCSSHPRPVASDRRCPSVVFLFLSFLTASPSSQQQNSYIWLIKNFVGALKFLVSPVALRSLDHPLRVCVRVIPAAKQSNKRDYIYTSLCCISYNSPTTCCFYPAWACCCWLSSCVLRPTVSPPSACSAVCRFYFFGV